MEFADRRHINGSGSVAKEDFPLRTDLARPRHVGTRILRIDDPRLLTGNGQYTADRSADRILHVAFKRSGKPHARIVGVDIERAKSSAGVVTVYCARMAVKAELDAPP